MNVLDSLAALAKAGKISDAMADEAASIYRGLLDQGAAEDAAALATAEAIRSKAKAQRDQIGFCIAIPKEFRTSRTRCVRNGARLRQDGGRTDGRRRAHDRTKRVAVDTYSRQGSVQTWPVPQSQKSPEAPELPANLADLPIRRCRSRAK